MNAHEFMASLAQGTPPQIYLLAGEEPYYIRRAEEAILRRLLPDAAARADALIRYEEMPAIDALAESLETAPFFTDKIVVLVHDAAVFRAGKKAAEGDTPAPKDAAAERLLALLTNLLPTTYVVFTLNAKPDKRRKLYQTVQKAGRILESEAVRPWNVEGWLNERLREMGRSMQREARTFFLNVVGMMQTISLEFLDRQLEKLTLYTDNKQFTEADLRAAFSEMPEVSVFALMDAISARDVRRAMDLLARCRADGVHFTVLLERDTTQGARQDHGAAPLYRRKARRARARLSGVHAAGCRPRPRRCRLPAEDGTGGRRTTRGHHHPPVP